MKRWPFGKKREIIERRKKVLRLRFIKQWPTDQIASVLRVSVSTIERDIKAIEEYGQQYGANLMQETHQKIIWQITENYQERQMLRWQEFANAKDPATKNRILRDIQAEEKQYIETMQSLGAMYKAPEETVVTQETWEEKIKRLRAERKKLLDELEEDGYASEDGDGETE